MELFWHDVKTESTALRAMSGWTVKVTDVNGRSFDASIHDARVAPRQGCELLYSLFGEAARPEHPPVLRVINTDEIALLEVY